jgi:hypothetical protein
MRRGEMRNLSPAAKLWIEKQRREREEFLQRGKLLCECETGSSPGERECSDWLRFCKAATLAGYSSGRAAANEGDLWNCAVDEAIAYCEQQPEPQE